jgi:hypothetical protein
MLRRIVPIVVLLAALIGGAAISLAGRVEFRPGVVVLPTADVSKYPQEYGPSKSVLAAYPVTVEDLDALGIDHGDWANGPPKDMELVMLKGSYRVPILSLSPRGAHLNAEYKIYVFDHEHGGIPTITVMTPYSDLVQRILDYPNAIRMP